MKRIVWLIVCCGALYAGASDRDRAMDDWIIKARGILGYGLELLLTKLNLIEHKLQQVQNQLNEYQPTHNGKLSVHKKEVSDALYKSQKLVAPKTSEFENGNLERIDAALQKLLQDVSQVQQDCNYHKVTLQLVAGMSKGACSAHTSLEPDCVTVTTEENSVTPTPPLAVPDAPSFTSCKDVPSNISATYLIHLKKDSVPFKVFCEQQKLQGGWIVIQHRYDGTLNFCRSWNAFRDGFGDLEKEFWLGLEKVHQITKDRAHELIIELKDFSGNYRYAHYDAFEIGSKSDQYSMKKLGSYNGTAGNSMAHSNGMKFTTIDRGSGKCATFRRGAWWHENDCTRANLNGRFINTVSFSSMFWFDFNRYQGLGFSRMMIRELE